MFLQRGYLKFLFRGAGFSNDTQISFADFEQAIAELVEQGKSGELIEQLERSPFGDA